MSDRKSRYYKIVDQIDDELYAEFKINGTEYTMLRIEAYRALLHSDEALGYLEETISHLKDVFLRRRVDK